jgi:acyl-CoA thioester hydrolase
MKEVHRSKVIFADTDAMGIVYYGIYFRWFEIGRTELLRKSNIVYKKLNDMGIHLPVIETGCRYLRPAKYDNEIRIFSGIERIKRARIRFAYRIESGGETLTTGFTEHAFTDSNGKVVRPPDDVFIKLQKVKDAL